MLSLPSPPPPPPPLYSQNIKKLLVAGADVNLPGQLGHTPLLLAVTHANDRDKSRSQRAQQLLVMLLEARADPNQNFTQRGCFLPRGMTPLLCATNLRHPQSAKKVCKLLLNGRATVSTPSAEGMTPLALACQRHSADPSLMRLLVQAQADLQAPGLDGLSPLQPRFIITIYGRITLDSAP